MIPAILIVGLGFMGSNHLKNLQILEKEGKVRIAAIVDSDPSRLTNLPYYTDTQLRSALQTIHPDIICLCTNTKTHFALAQEAIALCPDAALYIEKPLCATSSEAEALLPLLAGKQVSCGYLFRESPAVEAAIHYIQEHSLTLSKIKTIWQKNRMQKGPARPSAGVHIDEATHPIDLVLSILRQTGHTLDITIEQASAMRESELGIPIVDRALQDALYADEPDKLDPIAEVTYRMIAAGIPIEGFSSFAKGPQIRSIAITCTNGTQLEMRFDEGDADHLEINGKRQSFPEPAKLHSAWRTFLKTIETGEPSPKILSLDEMLFDIRLTESLEQPAPMI